MCLHTDPALTVRLLKAGYFFKEQALREIKNLKSEISSGIYTLEQLGLESLDDLDKITKYYT